MTKIPTRFLLVLLAASALVAGACSDSDDDGGGGGGEAAATFSFQPLEPGAVTFTALEQGDIDVAVLFSTQGAIAANDWVVLEDDQELQGAENVIPLIRTDVNDETITEALNELSAALTTEGLTELNQRVDAEQEDPDDVARSFLEEEGLLDVDDPEGSGSLTVGSTNFSETQIVAHMYALVLEAHGYDVDVQANLGSREVVYPAIESGEIDLTPEYIQSLVVELDADAEPLGTDEGVERLGKLLPDSLEVLEPAPAQDQNALVVTRETAEEYDLTTVSDLLDVEDELVLGGPPECPERPLCIPGYEEAYGLQFEV